MDRKALTEVLKSFLRFMYFGLLGLVGTFLTSLLANPDLQNTVIHIVGDTYLPVGAIIVAVLTGIVKLIDRYVYANKKIKSNGIAPNFLQK